MNSEEMDTSLDENRLITMYRDQMNLKRNIILNNYAKQTSDKGEMYYIYSKNSKLEDGYNLCICEEEKSHIVIEESKKTLPDGAEIGSVLRKNTENYVLDNEATHEIAEQIQQMKETILQEQTEFLESQRIEGHVYEMSEKDEDRAWLFDITNNSDEAVEEIDFPKELLQDAIEGDLFVYRNGEYVKKIS